MLAYAFWHWPRAGAADYEQRLVRFHSALAADPPGGFRGSVTLRHEAAPWLARGGYLDWYMLDGFADLDALNDAAVAGARQEPHDAAAEQAQGGAGGIYRLRSGPAEARFARVAHWFDKPAGVRSRDFVASLSALPGSLWMRQMAMGPSPEYALFALGAVALPVPALRCDVRCVWP